MLHNIIYHMQFTQLDHASCNGKRGSRPGSSDRSLIWSCFSVSSSFVLPAVECSSVLRTFLELPEDQVTLCPSFFGFIDEMQLRVAFVFTP
jgi:hypothetical protein